MSNIEEAIAEHVRRCSQMIDDYRQEHFKNLPTAFLKTECGRKYLKTIRYERDANGEETSHGVYSFIDLKTGDIYKPESWSKPAKHIRGNVQSPEYGLEACDPYGIKYLK